MDLKDDNKPFIFPEHPRIASRYFESNAGQLFVNNVNPFDTVGGYTNTVNENQSHINRNDEEFINLYDNTFIEETSDITSKAFLDELMRNYPLEPDMFVNEQYDEINEAYIADNQNHFMESKRQYSHTNFNISPNVYDNQYVTACSKRFPKMMRFDQQVRFKEGQNNNKQPLQHSNGTLTDPAVDESQKAEKTTYCRPLFHMHNQEYVYKTMQRNAKLQKLIRKMAIEREREKQREAWNNYINELKNKHNYYSNEPSRISPQYVPGEHNSPDEYVNDFYNAKYDYNESNPCQHLLHDFYDIHGNMPPDAYNKYLHDYDERPLPEVRSFPYESNPYCFPTSSQANILRRNMERQGSKYACDWRYRPSGRYFRGNTLVAERERRGNFDRIQGTSRPLIKRRLPNDDCKCKNKKCSLMAMESKPIQTDSPLALLNEEDDKSLEKDKLSEEIKLEDKNTLEDTNKVGPGNKLDCFKEKFKRVTNNIAKLKNKIKQAEAIVEQPRNKATAEELRSKSLAKIEEKIDCLLKSINTIMVDMKSRKNVYANHAAVSCKVISTSHNKLNRNKSDPFGMIKNEEYLCGMVQSTSTNLTISEICSGKMKKHTDSSMSGMDKILLEELKKSDQVKRDIEELLNMRNDGTCSVQITIDIPTKEISTEVTESLSKAGKLERGTKVVVQEVPSKTIGDGKHSQMTIAVNTDPLGLLALLRVSTEALKQLLSYMPNLNYNSYFSLLQLPTKACVSHYICNICGAAFGRPSQLSDHIEQHSLGRTRDCCVCRHSLDTRKNSRFNLFACRYCGQRFTRAYCCELHQRTCARRLGHCHDVNSSHILLR